MTELAKTFDPAAIEARWYAHWENEGLFRPDRPGAEPWTLVNPPPNVTGSLHIGHALDNTLQDIMTRYERMRGKDARWVVGTDHAGIATQMVVERNMALHQQKRTDFTREDFVAKVWEWKAESGGEITRQLRRLGCSMDWSEERFTMDEGFSKAVLKVFVDLYREGLLYRDKRLVNWDPGLGTAISDLEVETREVNGQFWHLRYPLEDGSGSISVATTRPETMLADMAVAVSAGDPRYSDLVGKRVRLPITGRLIPIIEDEHADPELGSGAVKITPGHDFNDFEAGKRAGFRAGEMLNMLDAKANVVQTADGLIPEALIGLSVAEARKRVVALLEEAGLLERVEDRVIQTPFGDRSGVVIEPWLTDQWYVDAATLAKPAIEAVRSGRIEIVPKTWEKTFFNWMENIQPWCVSRQLWWGHRIPAWSTPDYKREGDDLILTGTKGVYVAETEQEAVALAQADAEGRTIIVFDSSEEAVEAWVQGKPGFFDENVLPLIRDPDVLDTWFSSALWPFATLGWPDDKSSPSLLGEGDHAQHGGGADGAAGGLNPAAPPPRPSGAVPLPETSSGRTLAGRYPNDLLISGFDILFFWDARMMMQGLHFMGDVPFRRLYLHGLVRAADGQKMSKSKGNTVDPLGLIDRYGADALRFFMAAMESQGRDIKMDEKRVEGYRNFATKLWNAARFCQANGIGASRTIDPPVARQAVNKWIIGETVKTVQAVDLALADLRFDGAANAIYQFAWSRFCDWYVEFIKPVLQGGGPSPTAVRAEPVEVPSSSSEPGEGSTALRQAQGERGEVRETREVAGWVIDQILVLLHPFMPFITEELWHAMGERPYDLIVAKWPMADARSLDPAQAAQVEWLIEALSNIRGARAELAIPPSVKLTGWFVAETDAADERLSMSLPALRRLGRLETVWHSGERFSRPLTPAIPDGAKLTITADGGTFYFPLEGVIDIAAERVRLEKSIAAAAKERDALAGRLGNASFVERAKPEAVEKARADHADKAAEAERLTAALDRLG